jgi:NADH:ubiquinone oxidoreductase subunit B-like Fe-S oxidoreductase
MLSTGVEQVKKNVQTHTHKMDFLMINLVHFIHYAAPSSLHLCEVGISTCDKEMDIQRGEVTN